MAEEEIRARLKLSGRAEVQAELKRLQREIDRTSTAALRSSRQANTFGSSWGFAGNIVKSAANTIKYAAIGIIGAATGIGIAAAGMGVKAYMGYEQAKIAFTNLLKSGPKATQLLRDLQYLADHSPFELPGLLQGSQKLLAFGFAGEDIIPIMKRIGDASAGLAVGEEGIARITLALGQMRTAGRVNAMDLRQLSEVGIDVWTELAKAAGTTIPKVRKMVTEGKIGSEMGLRASFNAMEKFKGMTEEQAKTMGGLWATVKDGARLATRQAITPFAEGIKGALRRGIDLLSQLPAKLKNVSSSAKTMGNSIIAGFKEGGIRGAVEQIGIMSNKGKLVMQIYDFVSNVFQQFLRIVVNIAMFIRSSLVPAFAGAVVAVNKVINPLGVLRAVTGFMARNTRIMIPLIWALIAVWSAWKTVTLLNTAAAKIQNVQEQLHLLNLHRKMVVTKVGLAIDKLKYLWDHKQFLLDGIRLRLMYLQEAWATRMTLKTKLMTAAQMAFNAVMAINPVVLVIAAVIALAAGIYLLYRRSETFRNIVQAVWGWLKEHWPLLLGILTGPIGAAVAIIIQHWDTIKKVFKSVINWIIDRWNGLRFKIPTVKIDWNGPLPGGKVTVGGQEIGVPRVHRLHSGGTTSTAGVVNMRPREELVYLPKAASVVPLKSDIRPLSETGGSAYNGPERVVLEVDGKVLTEVVLGGVRKKVARS